VEKGVNLFFCLLVLLKSSLRSARGHIAKLHTFTFPFKTNKQTNMILSRSSARQRKRSSWLAGFDTQRDATPVQRLKNVKSVKRTYNVGDRVDVMWDKWYPCTVMILEKGGTYEIKPDGEDSVPNVEGQFVRLRNSTTKPPASRNQPAPSPTKQAQAKKAKAPPLSPHEEAALMKQYPWKTLPNETTAQQQERQRVRNNCNSARTSRRNKAAGTLRKHGAERLILVDKYNKANPGKPNLSVTAMKAQITVRNHNSQLGRSWRVASHQRGPGSHAQIQQSART
jgi:hypothetical protein